MGITTQQKNHRASDTAPRGSRPCSKQQMTTTT
jgi:hypothetical protein